MARILKWIIGAVAVRLVLATLPVLSAPQTKDESFETRKVTVGDGMELHYLEHGSGVPVVFVHGSLSDGGFWNEQLGPFAASGYRAIAYSRRYNPPNTNKPRPGYSAAVDADDPCVPPDPPHATVPPRQTSTNATAVRVIIFILLPDGPAPA